YKDLAREQLAPLMDSGRRADAAAADAPRACACLAVEDPLRTRRARRCPRPRRTTRERRANALANPGLGGLPFATPTLWAASQYLAPGETAPEHRHTTG